MLQLRHSILEIYGSKRGFSVQNQKESIRDIVNILSISWARNTARTLVGNISNVLMMYQLGFSQVHCPCPCNVFTMSWVRKLGFVPSEGCC